MKTLCTITLLLLAISLPAQSPIWMQLPNSPGPSTVRHDDIYFTDPTNGWATQNNNIYRTTNIGLVRHHQHPDAHQRHGDF